ncbi:hypothetical protein TL16_g03010 [Triparma laevis f. inornata]|uniref:Kinesin-like protein n=1 Tax=Triparma laevis f. inornata TaxID=1714386 RepID=A0A9W6ZTM5_9STRA|nr:hypothetical protein TL16_g03010 [Triparma laevis f. inornata]
MFGPPGIMGRAAAGEYGLGITPDYGIFPRAIISIFNKLKHRSNPCVLVASTIELAITGAVDMLVGEVHHGHYQAHQQTITVDNSADPPKAIGQSYIVINDERDILKVFSAISSRNTAGTGMNDSSSRSHCFAWLTLYSYDHAGDKLQTSRFQFVDLAGSERLKDAHNGNTNVRNSTADMNLIAGAVNNYSLMMLSTCIRDIVRALKSRSWDGHISYRKYLVPLVPLISESLTGEAPSLIVVCLSQAPANVMQCKFALDFGFTFSNLAVGSRKKRPERLAKLERIARETKAGAEAALEGAHSQSKTRNLREAQLVDSKNFLVVVDLLRK